MYTLRKYVFVKFYEARDSVIIINNLILFIRNNILHYRSYRWVNDTRIVHKALYT